MSKILTVELTDEEAKALEGLASRLSTYEKFIPAGILPIVKKVEDALSNSLDLEKGARLNPLNYLQDATDTQLMQELIGRWE
jgi:hypothetical protein